MVAEFKDVCLDANDHQAVRARDEDIDWDVLADPQGTEFCVFARRS